MPELLDKRLVFVTGKGGVGKTTVAVALGLRAAQEGKRTIVSEVSSQATAATICDPTEVGFHEVEMAENLWSISIDPDESMREYVLLQLKVRAMRDLLFRSRKSFRGWKRRSPSGAWTSTRIRSPRTASRSPRTILM